MTTYRQAIAEAMQLGMRENPKAIIYGIGATDIAGILGTTKGLEAEFGSERVFDTPICEETMLGFALGLSLNGHYPVNVHLRNDFLLLAMSQLVNSIAKYRSMYGGNFQAPMLIRAVIGRSWGQGAQHSQSLQSLFAHIPGLTVIMPASAESVRSSYLEAMCSYKGPVISLEHRFLYDYDFAEDASLPKTKICSSRIIKKGNDLSIVASSYMVQEVQKLLPILKDRFKVDVELIDIHSISHPDQGLILSSIQKTGKLLVADTSWAAFGLAGEISRWILESNPRILQFPMVNIALPPTPCPTAASLEREFYPSLALILSKILNLHFQNNEHQKTDAEFSNLSALEKTFKGPF
jgi:pyruvate dehydrogenase E1 component beta subunit